MPTSEACIVHEEDCELEGMKEPQPGAVRWRTLLSSDRTPTHSLTVGVAELLPGTPLPIRLHQHAQPEVYYILSGHGTVTIAGTDHPVRPGSTLFIPGDTRHTARNTGAEPLRLLYVFPSDSFAEIHYEFPDS